MEPDQASLNFSQWSLLSPSLVVTGGQAGQLHVMDLRVQDRQPIVWQALEAHTGTILDGQFNPFIPYWLASAGGDGIVNIWDLRATCHKPLAKIDGHLGPVTSIAWGNVRPEKLATTSRDGTFRMWSLSESSVPIWESCSRKLDPVGTNHGTPAWLMETEGHQSLEEERWWPGSMVSETKGDDFGIMADDGLLENNRVELVGAFGIGEWGKMQIGPLYYGNSHKKSKGAVVKALVSKCRPGQFYCATSFGQLCSQIFRPTSRGLLDYPHRFDYKKDPLYYTIDNAIHYRHIKVAEKFIDKLKSLPIEDEEQNRLRNDHVKDFENCLQLRPSIKPAEWEINCIPRHDSRRLWTETDKWQCALDTFRKDLAYWRCRIAPGCVTIFDGIPFDTGERHPRLCSEMMQGVIPGTDSILSSPPSPPTQLQPSSISTSRTNMDQLSIPKTKQSLRRSSTTPNMTSDDLLTPYEDLKSMNERNSSGTLLNTCINWKPLQRSKTTTPINHRDSRSSPLSSPTTTTPIKLQQQKDKSNADDDNEDRSIHGFDNTAYTSPTEMDFKSIIKYGSFGKQPLTTNSADDGIDDQPSRDHTVGTISPPAITKRSSTSDDIHDTEHDNLHSQVSNVNDTSRASPQAMDLKSIIKYGSFKQPPLDNKNQTGNEHDITRSSSHSSINHQINMDLTNNNIPTSRPDQSLLSSTMSSNSGDAVRPNLRRQPSSILAPAKSLGRAFTKKLKRKKTSASSSSPITPSDKDPENYRQQPQLDTSRPSPRNAL
ncbi:hypothetical protein BC941DRAFT_422864 [Chlamydoabsidia padenii]|nr:hypothetical protein BC941DRAFT_422864 [Chlamydoabsidia padenii]